MKDSQQVSAEENSDIDQKLLPEDQLQKIENLLEQVAKRSREFFIRNKIQNPSFFKMKKLYK